MATVNSYSLNVGRSRRITIGVITLLVVDIIWVASSELTRYIFKAEDYEKPFFSTYVKTSMFMLYLLGFLFWRPWREQCCVRSRTKSLALNLDPETATEESDIEQDNDLSDPLYIPLKYNDSDKDSLSSRSSSLSDLTDGEKVNKINKKGVRFSNVLEVRHMSDTQAEAAKMARLSYAASLKAKEDAMKAANKLPVCEVAKLSLLFCLVFFLGNISYQEALADTQVAVVNILSSTSGLFTLVLAAMFPSSHGDKFTLTKLVSVLFTIAGIVLVCMSDNSVQDDQVQLGALWALCGALLYAVYLVMLKRKVDNEERIDIPMFFGFVGLFTLLLLWPCFFFLNYTHWEGFELPSKMALIYLAVNGLVGTVLSEFLWLWGCFLTSSLIATLSLSLTIPLSMLLDIMLNRVVFNWMFFAGTVPVFLSFFVVALLSHYDDWDPVLLGLKHLIFCIYRKRTTPFRIPEDKEQRESLILNMHNMRDSKDGMECCSS
ncbi:solute carrier family 35 member F5-like [Ptychodera flava]|uniref:solute carrier family 35 member F5-like n=1 Tax=Ptychodera flava TaxID=63121 RepID=UPI00396A6F86